MRGNKEADDKHSEGARNMSLGEDTLNQTGTLLLSGAMLQNERASQFSCEGQAAARAHIDPISYRECSTWCLPDERKQGG